MSLILDHVIFGNGHGTCEPYFDSRMFWLVDTLRKERHGRNGRVYRWIGGLGAQLHSFEWFMPKPGTRRQLAGHEFVVFNAHRQGLRVDVSWTLARLPQGINEANAEIARFKAKLHSDNLLL